MNANLGKMNTSGSLNSGISATGIVLSVTGILGILIAVILQIFSINHGTSGQLTVDSAMKKTLALILTPTLILMLGAGLYFYVNTSERPFLILFIVCLLSYLLSNIAIVLSLYQIHVS